MAKLAINGGEKVIKEQPNFVWPPRYPETAERLKEIYLKETWSFYGPREKEFNVKYAEFTGAKHCIMMANGTVTLQCALLALGIRPGDEVIVPAHTWIATGEAVAYCNAVPVIVDIQPDTLCIDPDAVEAAITPKTRAIIPVHLYGSMADMDRIMEIARKHDLAVIEDCAHVQGSEWDHHHAGTIGNIGSFSFQQSKLLASGEGGACITNDDQLADDLGRLSHIGYPFGAAQGTSEFASPRSGLICYNFRLTDFQAEILLSQLAHHKEDNALRAKNAEYLRKRINAIPGLRVQAAGRRATLQTYYVFCVMVDPAQLKPGITRQEVLDAINAEGLGIGPSWGNVMYKQRLWSIPENMYRIESCETAERIVYNELMGISHPWLTLPEDQIHIVADAFEKVMNEYHA